MDIIQLGINVQEFTAQQQTVHSLMVELYNDIVLLESKGINPALGTGLSQFNVSMTETNALLTSINAKIQTLTTVTTQSTAATNSATAANNSYINSLIKESEQETQLAAAKTRTAAAETDKAKASLAASKIALQNASENQAIAASQNVVTQSLQLQSIAVQEGSAASIQMATALHQLNEAEQIVLLAATESADVQAAAAKVLQKAKLDVEAANQALLRSDAEIIAANQAVAASSTISNNAVSASAATSTRLSAIASAENVSRAKTSLIAAEADAVAANRALSLAEANLKNSSSSTRASNVIALQTAAQNNLTAANLRYNAAVQYQASLQQQVAVAQQRVADSALLSSKKQEAARRNLIITEQQLARAEAGVTAATTAQTVAMVENAAAMNASAAAGVNVVSAVNGIWSAVRKLAYILPGIGIAGIFSLALGPLFELIKGLDIFRDKLLDESELQKKINEGLSEQLAIYKSIVEQKEKIYQITAPLSSTNLANKYSIESAGGNTDITKSVNNLSLLGIKLEEARKASGTTDILKAKAAVDNITAQQEKLANDIKDIEAALELRKSEARNENSKNKQFSNKKDIVPGRDFNEATQRIKTIANADEVFYTIAYKNEEELKSVLSERQSALNKNKDLNKEQLEQSLNLLKATADLDEAEAAHKKLIYDNELNLSIEKRKSLLDIKVSENNSILQSDTKFFNEKKKALIDKYEEEVRLAKIADEKIQKSLTANEYEKQISTIKYDETKIKLENKKNEDLNKLQVEFYQRKIKTEADIQTYELNQQAIYFERIYKNETNSQNDRLNALIEYYRRKQAIQDVEKQRDLQAGKRFFGDTQSSLTPEEVNKINKNSETQKANIQADAEKQSYDIVKKSLDEKLKLIVDGNKLAYSKNKEAEAEELRSLNELMDNKKISYKEYFKQRDALTERYRRSGLDANIEDDILALNKLQDYQSQLEKNLEKQKRIVEADKSSLSKARNPDEKNKIQQDLDFQVGEQKAIEEELLKVKIESKNASDKLEDDKYKRQLNNYERLQEAEKRFAELRIKLENQLFDLIKKAVDADFERRIAHLQKVKEVTDQNYSSEIDAVEKSSLSQKDKAALEIQLKQQQIEFDKQNELEQRKIKIEQAKFEQQIAIGKIAFAAAIAEVEALSYASNPLTAALYPGVAALIAAVAAAEIAAVLAAGIPSFAEGVIDFEGGMARYGEAGAEEVRIPGRKPFIAMSETISYLPKGTDIIPISESPEFHGKQIVDNSWEQIRWLAGQMKKSEKKIVNKVVVVNDFGWQIRKNKILFG